MKIMKTSFFKKSVYAFAFIALAAGVSSCSDDDGKKKVVLPEVVIEHSISGVVTGIDGTPIEDVAVALSGTATSGTLTDENGVYSFEYIKESGDFDLAFTKDGKVAQEGHVLIADSKESHAAVLSVRMANEVAEVVISATEETVVETETETAVGNEEAATTVTTTVPAGAIEEGKEVVIKVQPIYDEVSSTKAVDRVVVDQFEAEIKLKDGTPYVLVDGYTVNGSFEAPINGQCFVRVVYADGTPSDSYTFPSGTFTVSYDRSCTIYVEADATITQTSGEEALVVTPSVEDRIHASGSKTIDVTYDFKMGAELTGTGKAREILEKYVAVANGTVMLEGEFLSNFEVPEGAKYTFSAKQHFANFEVDFDSNEATGKKYEDVDTSYSVEVPAHNGGGN